MSEFSGFLKDVVLPGLVSSGVALFMIRFLSESFIKNSLEKRMNQYKSELQEKTEYLKTKLSIYAKEQEVSIERVDIQRANAIHSVYQTICDSIIKITTIVGGPPNISLSIEDKAKWYLEQVHTIYLSTTNFNNLLRSNAIYFDNETYLMLHKYFEISATMTNETTLYLINTKPREITEQRLEDHRINMEQILKNKLGPIHQKTTDEFRFVLGIEKERKYKNVI